MSGFTRLTFDCNLKVKDLPIPYLYSHVTTFGDMFGCMVDNGDGRDGILSFTIEDGYVFVTVNTKKYFCVIKIEEDQGICEEQLREFSRVLNTVWYEEGSKEGKNLIKRLKNKEIEEIRILSSGELVLSAPVKITESELDEIKDVWGNSKPTTPSGVVKILKSGAVSFISPEENDEN